MSHFEQRLEADLEAIRDWVWQLGMDVEQALRNAKQALLLKDDDLAYATVLGDNPINRNSRACDRMCHEFIARHLPGAGHLREIAATIRVNVALERIGDYAVTISREAVQLKQELPKNFIREIDAISDDSLQVLHESRIAFRDDNAEQAKVLMQMAKRVEQKMDAIYDPLFNESSELSARTTLTLFIIFNMLKRVADQAKNICDQTVYAVRGVAKIPKVYRILFVDQEGSDAGAMALAIARKNFPTAAIFRLATPGNSQSPGESLLAFLVDNGLDQTELQSERLEVFDHDLADFDVIICLHGMVREKIGVVPFHTSVLSWNITESAGQSEQYRELREQIFGLLDLLAGEEAA